MVLGNFKKSPSDFLFSNAVIKTVKLIRSLTTKPIWLEDHEEGKPR